MPFALRNNIKASISFRIAFLFCATFAVGLTFAFLVTYFELRFSLERSSREILSAKLQEIKAILKTEGTAGLDSFLQVEKTKVINAPYMIRVLSAEGETLFIKKSIQEKNFDFETAFSKKIRPENFLGWQALPAIDDEDKFNLLTEPINENTYLQIGRSSEAREGILEEILLTFAAMEVLLVILSGILGMWYAKKSLTPIRNLLNSIQIIEKGNLSERVPAADSKGELRDLGDTFNRMIARIEKLIQVMKESLDNVAHDIRTPLTRIRIIAEDVVTSEDPVTMKEALADCAESANHISELVDQLLSISEAEAGTLVLRKEICSINLLLSDVVDIYEFVAQENNVEIFTDVNSEELSWNVDRKRIKQVIGNLLDNALKFSPQNSVINLSAEVIDGQLILSMRDHGIGIPESDINRIWDRLFRGDKNRTTKGLGLGLAIVRSVVMAHGGSVEARNATDVGMIFSVKLPA